VILVSYQPRDTLGWRLTERRPTVRILGREYNKWADVLILRGFSSHADHTGLLQALVPLVGQAGKIRLVHGELEAAEALARDLEKHGFADVAIPQPGETVTVEGAKIEDRG
jgi:metallo-beta-lactamase family protein